MHVSSAFEATFADTLSGIHDVASGVSLSVLRTIDETSGHLAEIERTCNGMSKLVLSIASQIRRLSGEPTLPDTGSHIEMAEMFAQRFAEAVVARLGSSLPSSAAPELEPHHVEFLSACNAAAVVATSRLSQAFLELRAALIDYELRIEPRDGPAYNDVPSFMAALNAA